MLEPSEIAFEEINESISEDQRRLWELMESNALANRIADPSAMDIFDTRLEKGMCSHHQFDPYR